MAKALGLGTIPLLAYAYFQGIPMKRTSQAEGEEGAQLNTNMVQFECNPGISKLSRHILAGDLPQLALVRTSHLYIISDITPL